MPYCTSSLNLWIEFTLRENCSLSGAQRGSTAGDKQYNEVRYGYDMIFGRLGGLLHRYRAVLVRFVGSPRWICGRSS